MNKLKFKIVTPERVVYQDDVDQVNLLTEDGELTILAHHNPLVALLKAGELRIFKDEHEIPMAVSDGFVEMRQNNQLVILADLAERAEEIDEVEVEKARQRAEKILKEKENISGEEMATIMATIEREAVRLNIAKKYRNLRGIRIGK